jgi:DNA-binding protein H-NS
MLADSIRNDPFARFERSSGGFLIPVALFVVGALITVWAANNLARLDQADKAAKLRAQAVQIQQEQRAKALQELKALIIQLQKLSPEEQQEFLKNHPQIKIVRQPKKSQTENAPPEIPIPEILPPETLPPETQQLETNQP